MKKLTKLVLIAALLTPLAAMPASAADHRDRHDRPNVRSHVVHDQRHFGHDRGRWVRARHTGRTGWWWVVGTNWTYYPAYPAVAYGAYPVAPAPIPVAVAPRYVAPAPFFGLSFNIR